MNSCWHGMLNCNKKLRQNIFPFVCLRRRLFVLVISVSGMKANKSYTLAYAHATLKMLRILEILRQPQVKAAFYLSHGTVIDSATTCNPAHTAAAAAAAAAQKKDRPTQHGEKSCLSVFLLVICHIYFFLLSFTSFG